MRLPIRRHGPLVQKVARPILELRVVRAACQPTVSARRAFLEAPEGPLGLSGMAAVEARLVRLVQVARVVLVVALLGRVQVAVMAGGQQAGQGPQRGPMEATTLVAPGKV